MSKPLPKERPLSPHLQTYKLPFAAVLSTLHRISGFVLATLGLLILVYWLVGLAGGPESMAAHYEILNNRVVVLVLFLLTQAVFYHLCNGIRHLFWDMGKGFEINQVNNSGRAVVVVSIIATVVFWIIVA